MTSTVMYRILDSGAIDTTSLLYFIILDTPLLLICFVFLISLVGVVASSGPVTGG